jgi:hypothetical protein
MTKLEVLQGLATFAMSCEANGVEFFYSYNPNSNAVYTHIYEGGKRTDSVGIEYVEVIYFDGSDGLPSDRLKYIIDSVIDNYFKTVSL